jgi:hypothetical protein
MGSSGGGPQCRQPYDRLALWVECKLLKSIDLERIKLDIKCTPDCRNANTIDGVDQAKSHYAKSENSRPGHNYGPYTAVAGIIGQALVRDETKPRTGKDFLVSLPNIRG